MLIKKKGARLSSYELIGRTRNLILDQLNQIYHN